EAEACDVLVRKARFLVDRQAAFAPLQSGGNEQGYVQAVVVTRINGLAVARVVLEAGSRAAPERIERRVIQPHVAGTRGLKISVHAGLGILRGQDAVEQRPLEVV